jgi:hypothetical protein
MTRIISSEGLPPIAGGQASDITYVGIVLCWICYCGVGIILLLFLCSLKEKLKLSYFSIMNSLSKTKKYVYFKQKYKNLMIYLFRYSFSYSIFLNCCRYNRFFCLGPKFFGKSSCFLFQLHPVMNVYDSTPFNQNYQVHTPAKPAKPSLTTVLSFQLIQLFFSRLVFLSYPDLQFLVHM